MSDPCLFCGAATTVALPHVVDNRFGSPGEYAIHACVSCDGKQTVPRPDAPTLKEVGINGFDFSTWFSLAGPPGLPKEIVTRLRNEAVKALADPEIKERYAALGLSANGSTPEELVGVVKEQLARYGKAIRDNHIKAE